MSQYDFCGYRDIYVEFSQLINFMPVKQRAYHMNLRITSHITVAHRRNKERAQGVPWAPPLRSKKGPIRSKIWGKRTQMGLFLVLFFMKITPLTPSLDQQEQNYFGLPNHIAQLQICTHSRGIGLKNCLFYFRIFTEEERKFSMLLHGSSSTWSKQSQPSMLQPSGFATSTSLTLSPLGLHRHHG